MRAQRRSPRLPTLVSMAERFLEEGTYLAFYLALLGGGFGLPIPEDLVLLTAGAFSRAGTTVWWIAAIVCYAGVISGDTALFTIAHKLGPKALDSRRFQKLLPPKRRERLESFFRRYGPLTVVFARHVPGLRAPLFALAGINRMPYKRFLLWDALALCISGPIVFGLGWHFAGNLDRIMERISDANRIILVIVSVVAIVWILRSVIRLRRRHPEVRGRAPVPPPGGSGAPRGATGAKRSP